MPNLTIAAAQSSSRRGDIPHNVVEHLRFIAVAASYGVDLLVFPELSLAGYELELASSIHFANDDPRLEPLRQAVTEHGMHILVSGPLDTGQKRPYLGALLFSPQKVQRYAKVHVHESELADFMSGDLCRVVTVRNVPIGLAICADTSHASHPAEAAAQGARLYVSSIMKTEAEYPAHAQRLQNYAVQHGMAMLTANYATPSGGRDTAGKSALWNERGELLAQAGVKGSSLVIGSCIGGDWRGEALNIQAKQSYF